MQRCNIFFCVLLLTLFNPVSHLWWSQTRRSSQFRCGRGLTGGTAVYGENVPVCAIRHMDALDVWHTQKIAYSQFGVPRGGPSCWLLKSSNGGVSPVVFSSLFRYFSEKCESWYSACFWQPPCRHYSVWKSQWCGISVGDWSSHSTVYLLCRQQSRGEVPWSCRWWYRILILMILFCCLS